MVVKKVLSVFIVIFIIISACPLISSASNSVDFTLDEESTPASVLYNVTVHSGAVVEERQYAELLNAESEEHYLIKTLTIDASGAAPIKINDYGFAGANGPAYISELNFTGSGDIVLGTSAFSFMGIESLTLPANIKFTENAEEVFVSCLRLKTADIYCELVPGIFEDCNLLETVNFKGNITAIPSRSFASAYKLKKLDIPTTVGSIGDEAFFGCYQMEKVTLHDGLETIGKKAFYDTGFSSVLIPATVKTIGAEAFGYSDNQKIDDFTIYGYKGTTAEKYAEENGFTFIPLDADETDKYTNVTLNSGDVVEASQYAEPDEYAEDYKAIGTVTFNANGTEPITVKRFGFSGNGTSLNQVKNILFFGTGDIILDTGAFSSSGVTHLNLPSNVSFANNAEYVFEGAKCLQKVTVACKLCPNIFSESAQLKEVEISQENTLEELPDSAFYLCSNLEKINFPSTLKKIGASCFYYSNLKDISLNEGLETIDDYAFYSATRCNDIEFPSTLKSIGAMAFAYCGFNSILLNNGLTSVGEKAFYGNNIKTILIPYYVKTIGNKAFGYVSDTQKIDGFTIYGYKGTAAEKYATENGFTFIPLNTDPNDKYINVTLNSGDVVENEQYCVERSEEHHSKFDPNYKYVNTVTFNAFGSEPITVKNSGFSGYVVPSGVNEVVFNGKGDIILDTMAFALTKINDLNLPSNIKFEDEAIEVFSQSAVKSVTIGCSMCEGMFYGCNNLVDIKFTPDNKISIIPKSAFELAEVKKIEIPASVKVIDDFAFYTSRLSELKLNEGLETIGESALQVWGRLETVTLPSTVKTIGDFSFYYSGLHEVNLNEGLETIGKQAFDGNMDMKSILVPKSVTNIGEQAVGYFQGKTIDGFTIYGYTGTAAENYAEENGFTFIPLDAKSSVEGVSYTPIWSSINDYSFKVGDRPLKLQVIEANGATRTFTRHSSNVDITAYDEQGNEVHDTSADLAYEVWTVKTRLTPDSDLKVRAKYDNVWESTAYDFKVTTLYSDQTLKSAELAKESGSLSPVDCKIVTGSGVKKVRIEYEDGMTTTVNTSLATFDETNLTYTYNITAKPRHSGENLFKVYIKTSDGWKLATTLTYTAE